MKIEVQTINSEGTEGMEVVVGNITIWVLRQAAEQGMYFVTIQEDGVGPGVEIGKVETCAHAFTLITAILEIKKA